ncbi:MAG TPA: methionyl-tRNA formyltransferase [Vicinamibacterales bacterium]|nr:methionyl-tRNA formyltransferase [Vicinamibacterales bacterium]
MRIAFFGTPGFAVPTLAALLGSSHEVVVVVTQPDRPRGRGQRVSAGPVKALALDAGVPVVQPDTLARETWEPALHSYGAELGVVAAYGRILPDWLLTLLPRGFINVHASLLPCYRGASPIHRAVMKGDRETGVTIMRVVKALDAGARLATTRVPIGPDDQTDRVEHALAEAGARLLVETVDRLARGPIPESPQDDSAATYAPRIRKEEGLIDWARPARAIHNQVRGLHPWPHAFTYGPAGRLILHRTRVGIDPGTAAAPGTVVAGGRAEGLTVATGEGVLEVLDLQAEGGRVLPARDFLAGHPLPPGTRLDTP